MDSKQLSLTIRTLIQAELRKTLKPLLREVLKPLLQEMVNNKVNEILAEKYVQSMSIQQQVISEQPKRIVSKIGQIPDAQPSRLDELKRKYQVDNSPLGALMEGMEDHELRAAMSHVPGAPMAMEDDDDEGVPLDMIAGLMRK